MESKLELEERLKELRRKYTSVYSLLSMMEKGTRMEDLVKMRKEQLDPIKREMDRIEHVLKEDPE